MFWVSKVFAPLALVAGIAAATAAFGSADGNQPPFGGKGGKDDKKKTDDKKTDDKKGQPGDKKTTAPAKPDAVVDAWVKVLIEKITDPHDTVRDSARGALVGVGPAAVPALQKLADGDDPAKAVAARKLINAIQGRGGDRGERGGPGGMGPGGRPGMGMGPMGMGGRGFGGFGPGGFGRPGGERGFGRPGGMGGDRGRGPGRPGRNEQSEIEVAPMPHAVATR